MRKRAARRVVIAGLLLPAMGPLAARAGTLSIETPSLRAGYDSSSEQITLSNKLSQRVFATSGWFYAMGGSATVAGVTNAVFGEGQKIDVARPNGNHDAILLFTNLPFALFQTTLSNGTAQAVVSNKIQTVSVVVDVGAPAANLKTLGTGGLLAPGAANSGSYAWLAVADPTTRNGVVGGWITHDRGSSVIFHQVTNTSVQVNARVDYGRLRLSPGQSAPLEMFAVGYFEDARLGLEAWADTVAQVYDIHLPPQPAGYCTWYSSPNGGSSDQTHLAEWADCAATNVVPFGFSFMQIDDHWQAGYSTNGPKRDFTTNNSTYYPSGMKPAADHVKAEGMVPGLWFMPFAGTYYDPVFTNHLDWFVKTTNGAPYETSWGGTCLDMTYQPTRDYVSNVVHRISHDWGFQYFKMDGLWTGTGTKQQYINSYYKEDGMGDAVFSNPDKPNIEAFRDGLRLVRQAAGTNVFILGCNPPQNMRSYGGAFGLVDAMRIGPDNGTSWSSLLRGPTFGSRQYFLHGRIWYNDPDPVYVRSAVPLNQSQAICSWVTVSGQLSANSEWLPALPADRVDLLRRTMPSHGLLPRPVDLFENDPPRIWLLTDTRRTPRRDVIALFNWSDTTTQTVNVALSRIGLAGTGYVGFDFWANGLVPVIQGTLQATLPPQTCRIIAVRPGASVPQLISTSRHITQGMVDVLAETWDGTNTLSGTSQVVGGDPYQLRTLSTNGWRMQTAAVSAADQAAGVTASLTQSNNLARVTLQSPVSRNVNWSATYLPVPTVTLTSPTNNAVYYTSDTIPLAADASDTDGTITNVDFYRGTTKLGTAIQAPYSLSVSNFAVGLHSLTAVAADNNGNRSTSAVVQVQVQLFVPFTLSAAPASRTVAPGSNTSYTITIATTNGFSDQVSLSLGGLPVGTASSSFNPASVSGPGSSTLTVMTSNGIAAGTYPLTIAGFSGGLSNTTAAALVVNGAVNLRWDPSSAVWDVTNTANWLNLASGTSAVFTNGDTVLFDDNGGASPAVTLDAGVTVMPSALTNDSSVFSFAISGAGRISGNASIVKLGDSTLTLSTSNDFTGPVTVREGTLKAGNAFALGSGSTGTVVADGATLDVNGIALTNEPITVSGTGMGGAGAVVNTATAQQINALKYVTLAGDTTFGGTGPWNPRNNVGRWDIRTGSSPGTATLSTGGQPFKLTKTGGNQISLVAVNVDSALGDIDIQQGMMGFETSTTSMGNPASNLFVRAGATMSFYASTARWNKRFVLYGNGAAATITNWNGSNTVVGPVTLNGNCVFGVAGTALAFYGPLGGTGGLTKNLGSPLYLYGTNTYTGDTTVNAGTLALCGSASISNSPTLTLAAGAWLSASGRIDRTLTLAAGQTLSGSGTVGGSLLASPASTVAPGSPAGALTVTNIVTLQGATLMRLDRSVPTNSAIRGAMTINYGGTLMLTNGGGPLAHGDSFKLFDATNYTGAFTILVPATPGDRLVWDSSHLTNDGTLSVRSSLPLPIPRITAISCAGTNLLFSGTNGLTNANYYLLTTTNIALPLTGWSRLATNAFDAYGNFALTNGMDRDRRQRFFLLQLP